ncbi:MAG: ABC transporter permease [Chloroflexi bacterium]|nr:ABC transporter permease [Chloroflexota bacterium]
MRISRWLKGILSIYTAIFVLVLYAPFLVMAILSFQVGPEGGPQFPLKGLSIYWYKHLFRLVPPTRVAPLNLTDALVRSLTLAVIVMVVATILGTLTALAFRRKFKGASSIFYLVLMGIMVPGVLVSLGLAMTANWLNMDRNWYSTGLVAHVLYAYPFSFVVMLAIFNRFDRSLEEAAMDLGASEWVTFRRITFPLVLPGIIASALFGFTLSFDEFARSVFAVGSANTLPLEIFGTFSIEIHPNLFAWGVLTTLLSLTVLAIAYLAMTFMLRRTAQRAAVQEEI